MKPVCRDCWLEKNPDLVFEATEKAKCEICMMPFSKCVRVDVDEFEAIKKAANRGGRGR